MNKYIQEPDNKNTAETDDKPEVVLKHEDIQNEFGSKSIEQFAFDDEEDIDLANGSDCKGILTKKGGVKIAFMIKGGSVIYVMTSKRKHDTLSFMKK
jgi:hypothetical protein